MVNVWKEIARLKKGVRQAATDISDAVEGSYERAKTSIEKRGGVGSIVKESVHSAGEAIGKGIGHTKRGIDETVDQVFKNKDYTDPKTREEIETQDTDTVTRYGAGGRKAAAATTKAFADAGRAIKDAAYKGARRLSDSLDSIGEKVSEFEIPEEDRMITIGRNSYRLGVEAESRTELKGIKAEVGSFMRQYSRVTPSRTAGRQEVLEFIAEKGIKDVSEMSERWVEERGDKYVKALEYFTKI